MATIGVLALQGAFIEHEQRLAEIGVIPRAVRLPRDLVGLDALILPGGESTTFYKLIDAFDLRQPLISGARAGMPMLGTCAGAIILSSDVAGGSVPPLGIIDARIRRNAFGRQADSFFTDLDMPAVSDRPVPAVFIRAPIIEAVGPTVEVLATLADGRIVAAQSGNIVITSFHPELTADPSVHRYLAALAVSAPRRAEAIRSS
jgi:5'-phosphate synthase pdxT subunit